MCFDNSRISSPPSLPRSSDGKESVCNARDQDLITGSERSPGEGNGSPLQSSCLINIIHIGASQVALVVKNLPANAGDVKDMGSIPGLGRSPGGGYGNPLQYSCLENPMDRGAWWAAVHRVAKSWMTEGTEYTRSAKYK